MDHEFFMGEALALARAAAEDGDVPVGCVIVRDGEIVRVRVDTALYTGYEVPPYYDSLLAKVLTHGSTRLEAIRRMRRALEELIIEGCPTNAPLAHLMMHDPDFVRGRYDTGFLDQNLARLLELARTCDRLMEGET